MSTRLNKREYGIVALMLTAISIAFGWVLRPFRGAILWAVLLSTIFLPWYQALLARMPRWRTAASGATVLLIAILVVFPLTLVASALLQEVSGLVGRFQTAIALGVPIHLPEWAANLLTRFELTGLPAVQERLSTSLTQGWQPRQRLELGGLRVQACRCRKFKRHLVHDLSKGCHRSNLEGRSRRLRSGLRSWTSISLRGI